jgi:hypothetical protein
LHQNIGADNFITFGRGEFSITIQEIKYGIIRRMGSEGALLTKWSALE